jgi:hypothetical protein
MAPPRRSQRLSRKQKRKDNLCHEVIHELTLARR